MLLSLVRSLFDFGENCKRGKNGEQTRQYGCRTENCPIKFAALIHFLIVSLFILISPFDVAGRKGTMLTVVVAMPLSVPFCE